MYPLPPERGASSPSAEFDVPRPEAFSPHAQKRFDGAERFARRGAGAPQRRHEPVQRPARNQEGDEPAEPRQARRREIGRAEPEERPVGFTQQAVPGAAQPAPPSPLAADVAPGFLFRECARRGEETRFPEQERFRGMAIAARDSGNRVERDSPRECKERKPVLRIAHPLHQTLVQELVPAPPNTFLLDLPEPPPERADTRVDLPPSHGPQHTGELTCRNPRAPHPARLAHARLPRAERVRVDERGEDDLGDRAAGRGPGSIAGSPLAEDCVEYDAVVVGVGVVPVRVPRGRLRVDFDVPPAEDAADPDQRVGEIGSAVSVGDAGKADLECRSVRRQEGEARERLALPDAPERLFARVVPAQVTAPPPGV